MPLSHLKNTNQLVKRFTVTISDYLHSHGDLDTPLYRHQRLGTSFRSPLLPTAPLTPQGRAPPPPRLPAASLAAEGVTAAMGLTHLPPAPQRKEGLNTPQVLILVHLYCGHFGT